MFFSTKFEKHFFSCVSPLEIVRIRLNYSFYKEKKTELLKKIQKLETNAKQTEPYVIKMLKQYPIQKKSHANALYLPKK